MRSSRLLHIVVAVAIVAGSLFLYPTALQADMCGSFGHDFFYYGSPDSNGNLPLNPIGEEWLDCDGNYGQWGVLSGVAERHWTYCGDCEIQ
jgi:hypothetical protein